MDGIYIDESMIAKYLFQRLIEDGYVPAADEVLDLAEYVFDFLMEMSMIPEETVEMLMLEEDREED